MLSTPPAFILSQDQTLIKSLIPSELLWLPFKEVFRSPFYLIKKVLFVSEYSQVLKAETTLKPVRIFRVVLLFSYQGTLSLSVSSCRSHQRQLVYISIISFVCQELF